MTTCDKCGQPLVIVGTQFLNGGDGPTQAVCGCGHAYNVTDDEYERVLTQETAAWEAEHAKRCLAKN